MAEKGQFRLERILREKEDELILKGEKEKASNLEKLIEIYYNLKDIVYESYYPQIEKLFPWYTDHGQRHVESIIIMLGELLEQSYGRLNEMEVFVLLCACIFHDTGMTISRDNHADGVKEIIQGMQKFIPNITVMRQINEIAKSHSSKKDLSVLKQKDSCTYKGIKYSVQTRALAAMLRLVDDISETRYRIMPELLDKVPKDYEIFWNYANVVESSNISPADMICQIKLSIPQSILLKEYQYGSIENKIFFEYVLERLEKSYKERVLCSIEFRNIVIISAFEITLNIMTDDLFDEVDILEFEINENYFQTMSLKEAFFEKNPDWTIDALKKKYKS